MPSRRVETVVDRSFALLALFCRSTRSQITLLTLVATQSGMERTVAVYQSPEAPMVFIISDFPRLSRLSSLVMRSIQLPSSTLVVPK